MALREFNPSLNELRYLCRAKRHNVLERVSDAVFLAVTRTNDGETTASPGASFVVDPHIHELTRQLVSTRAADVTSMAKLSNLNDLRHKAEQVHDDLVRKIWAD